MSSIQLHPVMPTIGVVAILVIAVFLCIWLNRLESRSGLANKILLGIRLAAIATIGLLLLNPVRVKTFDKPTGKSPLLVLVDTSHSMSVADVGGKKRIDAIRKALFGPGIIEGISKQLAPAFFEFSGDATRQSPTVLEHLPGANGTRTCIGESMADALASISGAHSGAVLVLSDGRDQGEIAPAEVAKQSKERGFPVYTVCVGSETKTRDVAVVMNRPQVFSSINQEVLLTADISTTGYENVTGDVRLLREGKTVAEKTVPLSSGEHSQVSFPAKEAVKGTYRYTVEVVPLPGEITTANNRSASLLTVGNETTQVLVLEGRPGWDTKFMVQALRSDPSLNVDSIFQLAPDRTFAVRGGGGDESKPRSELKVPTTRAEFAKYDVVILGKGAEKFLTGGAEKELQRYVSQDGGHLIFLRGQADPYSTALAEMEPVTWSDDEIRDLRMKVTQEGVSNPAFAFDGRAGADTVIQKLPSLISATHVKEEKALAVVLARAQGTTNAAQPNRQMAVLAYQRYGDGLVLSLVGEGLWRWALLPPELVDYTDCYNDFWTQVVRWMVNQSDFLPGQNLSIRTDHVAYSPGEAVNLMVFVRGSERPSLPPVDVIAPNGTTWKVGLSKGGGSQADFMGLFRPKLAGDYIASLSEPGPKGGKVTAPFSVYERQQEDMNTSADPGLMSQIASAGGGRALALDEIGNLPSLLKHSQAWVQRKPQLQSVWDRWPILLTILGLLSIEWFARRRMGLV